jgi:hypothetical protein
MLFKNENLYSKELLQASQEEGVPMSVLKGFFALESQFNASSYRFEPHINDASYGISQILYNTAKGLGYKGTPEGLFDPYTSAKYGARFLANLHKKYPDTMDVIAAYNMGWPRPAARTTRIIIGIYGEPGPDWKYANQPYVDRVASYVAYYEAVERRDEARANEIAQILRKKSNWPKDFAKYTEARRYLPGTLLGNNGDKPGNHANNWGSGNTGPNEPKEERETMTNTNKEEAVKACPFIPPIVTKGSPLNPQQPTAHLQPCLGEMCQVWSKKRQDCGAKAIEPKE